jgi:hypothetical protein
MHPVAAKWAASKIEPLKRPHCYTNYTGSDLALARAITLCFELYAMFAAWRTIAAKRTFAVAT